MSKPDEYRETLNVLSAGLKGVVARLEAANLSEDDVRGLRAMAQAHRATSVRPDIGVTLTATAIIAREAASRQHLVSAEWYDSLADRIALLLAPITIPQ